MKSPLQIALLLTLSLAGFGYGTGGLPILAADTALQDGWHQGPPAAKVYGYGAVILNDEYKDRHKDPNGFRFADFCGDYVRLIPADPAYPEKIPSGRIAYYNNSIQWPLHQGKTASTDPAWMNGFMRTVSQASAAGPRQSLRRAALRTALRLKMARADAEHKAAIGKVLADNDLFESLLDGVSHDYNTYSAKAGDGKVLDFLSWVIENWASILEIVMQVVTLFADADQQGYYPYTIDGPQFVLASHCTADACTASHGDCACSHRQRLHPLANGRRFVRHVAERVTAIVGSAVRSRPLRRIVCCG